MSSDDPHVPGLALIMRVVADQYGITVAQMRGGKRVASLVRPRHIAVYLMREMARASYPKIAHTIGMGDHTSALAAYRTMVELCITDANVQRVVRELRQALGGDEDGCPSCAIYRAELAALRTGLDALRVRMGGCGD